MPRQSIAALLALVTIGLFPSCAAADGAFGYKVEFDIPFGTGLVSQDGDIKKRPLLMDAYTPVAENSDYTRGTFAPGTRRPAVIYVHGGAYHRGGRRLAPFQLEAAVHSRPEDYARLLAPLGYVVFVVEYRLAQENPVVAQKPGENHLVEDVSAFITDQAFEGTVRARVSSGLPGLENTPENRLFLWNAALAGAEDVNKAVSFVIENAERFNIDPEKIAMGGHSAGAGITLNVALGMRAPLAAIFPLSGPDILYDHDSVAGFDDLPPTLLAYSQFDEHLQLGQLPGIVSLMKAAGIDYSLNWIPGFAHFYPHNAVSLGDDGSRMPLSARIVHFLDANLSE
ncbi:alpha/beta hydrolase [Shimia sp. W99]